MHYYHAYQLSYLYKLILRSSDEAVFKTWDHLQEREEDAVFMSLSRVKENLKTRILRLWRRQTRQ